VLNTAVSDRYIRFNPCNIKGAGIERAEERPVATVEQVAGLAAAMQDRYRLMVLLACFASLRYGELTGLRRAHVDLEAGVIRISAALIQPGSAPMFDGDPKSRAGRRTVHLPPLLISAVQAHLDTYVGSEPSALLFVGPKGGRPRRSNFHRIWDKARKQVGVPELHFHDLRHTGNMFAAATGASLKDLMARMGHASSRAAMVYQHATEQQGAAIANGLDAVVAELVKGGRATTGQKE
jgi:integrase